MIAPTRITPVTNERTLRWSRRDLEAHWDEIYTTRSSHELGWYEPEPSTLELVTAHTTPANSVIDVGAGDGRLVDELLDRGYRDVTVLDVSGASLERARDRLGARADEVEWIHADVTRFVPVRTWDLWHDRAVFHFLVEVDERDAYRAAAGRAVSASGKLVIASFRTGGPDHCAGLPVCRYDPDSLPAEFGPTFEKVSVDHLPSGRPTEGDQRPYVAAVLARGRR